MPDTSPRPIRFLDRTTPPHIVTLVIIAGMSALAMNIFLPSLPQMATWFNADYAVMQLSVSLFMVGSAVLQVIIGPVSDRFGRRRALIWTTVLFLFATVGTLLAPNATWFLVFRMLQATIAAGMVLSRAMIRDMVPAAEAASMIGYVTMGMSIVPMLGPVLGGALAEVFGWQSNFVVLLILGAATLWLILVDLGETAVERPSGFCEQFRQYPALFASPRFWGYCLCTAFNAGAFYAYLGGAPYVGSEIFRLSPGALGLFFAMPAIGYALGSFLSGRFSARVGIDRMTLSGCIVTVAGTGISVLLQLFGISGPYTFFGATVLLGLGNGLAMPNSISGMLSVRPALAGTASGIGGAIMVGSGAALSALAGWALRFGQGAMPLSLMMLATTALSLVAILLVIRRNSRRGFG